MTFEPHTLPVLAIVFLSTFTRATFGFGDALVAMPLLAMLFDDITVATPLVALISTTVALAVVAKEWRNIRMRSAWLLVASSLAGIPLGLYLLTHVDPRLVKIVLAVVIAVFSLFAISGPVRFTLQSDRPACAFGFAAGILGGAYNMPGPPLVVFGALRQWTALEFRATLQGYFLPTGLLILAGHAGAGLWTWPVWKYFAACLPAVAAATLLGSRLGRRMRTERFLRLVHALMIVLAVVLLVEALRSPPVSNAA